VRKAHPAVNERHRGTCDAEQTAPAVPVTGRATGPTSNGDGPAGTGPAPLPRAAPGPGHGRPAPG
jgi:hypothetical protein